MNNFRIKPPHSESIQVVRGSFRSCSGVGLAVILVWFGRCSGVVRGLFGGRLADYFLSSFCFLLFVVFIYVSSSSSSSSSSSMVMVTVKCFPPQVEEDCGHNPG